MVVCWHGAVVGDAGGLGGIHHRGGPIFFALSLIPLFGFLWWLRRGEAAPTLRAA